MSLSVRKYTFEFPLRAISKDNEKIMNKNGRFFLSKRFKDFEYALQYLFLAQKPKDFQMFTRSEELCVDVTYYFSNKKHPDGSNLPKSTFDAFNKLLWWDDRQILNHSVEVVHTNFDGIRLSVFNLI